MTDTSRKLPLVVIFGRVNVGKSTLLNRLAEKNIALTSAVPGTTRDSNRAEIEWRGTRFTLIDTGGITDFGPKRASAGDTIPALTQKQAINYLKKADLTLFLVDARDGIMPQDKQLSKLIKITVSRTEDVVLTANKADNLRLIRDTAEFNKLSLGEPVPVSAATGSGTGDLLDEIVERIGPKIKTGDDAATEAIPPATEKKEIAVAIIGKPNVGKSSLVNALAGRDTAIVSPVPHTTREPRDIALRHKDKKIIFIDTAGISKRGQKGARIEKLKKTFDKLSIAKSLGVIKRADVALLLIDTAENITRQDAKLAEDIVNKGAGLIIVANKWDLVEERDTKRYTEMIYRKLPFVAWAPIQFVSAKTGEKTKKIMDLIIFADEQRKITINDNALAKFLAKIVKRHRPAKAGGLKHPRVYEMKQTGSAPPRFEIRIGAKDTIHFSYLRFIENRLREKFGFAGTPIRLKVVKNKRVHGAHSA